MFFLTRRTRRWLVYLASLFALFIVFAEVEVQEPVKESKPLQKKERRITEVWNQPDPDDIIPPPLLERTRLWWGTNVSAIPTTKIHRHVPGWTLMDNVYVFKGAMYIVSDNPEQDRIPQIQNMISSGKPIRKEPGDEHRREPTDQNMQVITSRRALQLFGQSVKRVEGTSFTIYEPSQYFSTGFRFVAAHVQPAETWSDYSDLANVPHIYDRILLADRAAAVRNSQEQGTPFTLLTEQFYGSTWWWEPIKRVLSNAIGRDYSGSKALGRVNHKPVITYIASQGQGGRTLHPDDHEDLVRQLNRLEGLYGYSIRVHQWSTLTLQDQMEIGRESDILMAVHGDGLLPFMWMSQSPVSSIIEFNSAEPENELYEDYAWTALALNISTYSLYGSSVAYKYPDHPRQHHGRTTPHTQHIKIDGNAVTALCVDILSRG
ncbi:hypothetical protein M407DRAFT_10077 [Tulasnella calospora MUT 4182]|uniref:Glycosyltransferase family 61 protein n=1 Tax=Tulasnella calospora MUT 4182 TaxID=1051891 RepID=A0A0C3QC75_9AGAM|nr:hypothetical protein M407DRAFT_10077 [Tulasnella calospora MUT 4182]